MHWFLQFIFNVALLAAVIAAYYFYRQYKRQEIAYARLQLYEDADKPCASPLPQAQPPHPPPN